MRRPMLTALFAFLALASSAAAAADLSKPLTLVAAPELRDALYGRTVVVVTPIGHDRHVGFIVNRPTQLKLGTLFPEHAPSQKIVDPVYLGGPVDVQAVFALVRRAESPGERAVALMPGLYAVLDAPSVDRIIESDAEHARFVAGLVVWRGGELQAELDQGAWLVREADPDLVLRDPSGLWEALVRGALYRIAGLAAFPPASAFSQD